MKHLLLGSVAAAALIGMGVAASAADLGRPAPAPVYTKAPIAAPFSWTGFYLGGHVGGAWTHDGITDRDEIPGTTYSNNASGFLGGAQVGYNWQTGPMVFGIEV